MNTIDASHAYTLAVMWMSWLAALAMSVNAMELLIIHRAGRADKVWHSSALAAEWGVFAPLLNTRAFAGVQVIQLLASISLALFHGTAVGTISTLTLLLTTILTALRFRGTVNGGSDGMLFTVLGGLTVAQWPGAPELVREGGVLYVAAQLTLSYVRAGVVKVRERDWWTGHALGAFLRLPAYGVPRWVPQQRALLVAGSLAGMAFECLAPLAWLSPATCVAYIIVAVMFHAGAAMVFGLNRFLLAWGAALPTLWFAVQRAG